MGLRKQKRSSVDRNLLVLMGSDLFSLQAAVRSLSTGPKLSFFITIYHLSVEGISQQKNKSLCEATQSSYVNPDAGLAGFLAVPVHFG